MFPGEKFRRVAAGTPGVCAIRDDGSLVCRDMPAPVETPGPWIEVAVGDAFACAIAADHGVSCWGMTPPASGLKLVRIAAGGDHACGIDTAGGVQCWGAPFDWYRETFAPPAGVFADVAVGSHHACARRKSGEIDCWGTNQQGQVSGVPPWDRN
jgi:alpha-tubulin suppressor-like RCC1 family protein